MNIKTRLFLKKYRGFRKNMQIENKTIRKRKEHRKFVKKKN